MRKTHLLAVVTTIVSSILLTSSNDVQAQAVNSRDQYRVPIAESPYGNATFNPCTGEEITLTGDVQISERSTYDASGAPEHYGYSIKFINVTGTSTSGIQYRVIQTENFVQNQTGAELKSWGITAVFISPGGESDFISHSVTKMIADPQTGEVKLWVDKLDAKCTQGGF